MPPSSGAPYWLDVHLSPSLAPWLSAEFGVEVYSFERLGLLTASDQAAFSAARRANAIILTKDADFPAMLGRRGPPPRVIWLTLGNTSSANLRAVLQRKFAIARDMLDRGETLVEISAA